jgi:type VI secretion system protein ImpA
VKYFASIGTPVSEDLPCGAALEGEAVFENFLAAAEAQLPASFANFSKTNLDTAAQLKQINALLERSRDLRLLVLAAKYLILSEDLIGFSDALHAMSVLLGERWEHVHPQALDGDYSLRSAQIGSLDDLPRVILPLQSAPLIKDRKLGPLSYRAHLLATGKVKPRRDKEEAVLDQNTVREAFLAADDLDGFKFTLAAVRQSCAALKSIHQHFADKVGYEHTPSLEKLKPPLDEMEAYLSAILLEREPAAALAEEQQTLNELGEAQAEPAQAAMAGSALPPPRSVADASEAIKAIIVYYQANEPSSPALLLTKQAQQLVGKSFVEAMNVLAPEIAKSAAIKIDGGMPFTLNFAHLKTLAGDEASNAAADAPTQSYVVAKRTDAANLMLAIEAFYRKNEPSSPIPLLIERARLFIDKDFRSLLKEVAKPEKA